MAGKFFHLSANDRSSINRARVVPLYAAVPPVTRSIISRLFCNLFLCVSLRQTPLVAIQKASQKEGRENNFTPAFLVLRHRALALVRLVQRSDLGSGTPSPRWSGRALRSRPGRQDVPRSRRQQRETRERRGSIGENRLSVKSARGKRQRQLEAGEGGRLHGPRRTRLFTFRFLRYVPKVEEK